MKKIILLILLGFITHQTQAQYRKGIWGFVGGNIQLNTRQNNTGNIYSGSKKVMNFDSTTRKPYFYGSSTLTGNLDFTNITANRSYRFPDSSGTLALKTNLGIDVSQQTICNLPPWNTATDGAEAVYQNDTLFMLPSWFTGRQQYYSLNDGQSWVRAKDAEFSPRHTYPLAKKGVYWYITGSDFNDTATNNDQVWRSRDLLTWTKLTDAGGWSTPRGFMGIWVKGDTLFTGGGQNQVTGTPTVYRDLWKSTDGITWTQVCASCLPNVGNLSGTFAMKNDTAYIVAGGIYGASYDAVKTVYRSVNMRTWTLVTSLPTTQVGFMYPKVFTINNMICSYGGYNNRNTRDLFCSFNGNTWYNFKDTTFQITHAAAIAVKNNTSFVMPSGSDVTKVYKFNFNDIIETDTVKRHNSETSNLTALFGQGAGARVPYYANGNQIKSTDSLQYSNSTLQLGIPITAKKNNISIKENYAGGTDASHPGICIENTNSGGFVLYRSINGSSELWNGVSATTSFARQIGNIPYEVRTNDIVRTTVNASGEFGIGKVAASGNMVDVKSNGNTIATNILLLTNSSDQNIATFNNGKMCGISTATPQNAWDVRTSGSGTFINVGNSTIDAVGEYTGITLGYAEDALGYRKVGIVTEGTGDGNLRNNLRFLVNGRNNNSSAELQDTKFSVDYNGHVGTARIPNSTFHDSGSFAAGYVAKTADYTLTDRDYLVNCTSNSFTITLPTAVGITGRMYIIKNTGTATTITIASTSSQTIDGLTPSTYNITTLAPLRVMSDGANWIVW